MVNYKHLHYFWMVANEGSIARASEKLLLKRMKRILMVQDRQPQTLRVGVIDVVPKSIVHRILEPAKNTRTCTHDLQGVEPGYIVSRTGGTLSRYCIGAYTGLILAD